MKRHESLICECTSVNHQVVFWLDEEDGIPMAYVHVSMSNRPFLKRLKQAWDHILGKKSKYGHFEETIISRDDIHILKSIIDHFEKNEKTNTSIHETH